MSPFDLPAHRLAAFARPVLEYLPAGFGAKDAARAEIDDIGSLAALASPDVVAARIGRLEVNVSTWDMTERLLEASDDSTIVSGLRYLNLDPAFPFVAVKTTARVNNVDAVNALAAQVAQAYRSVGVRGFTFWEQSGLDLSSAESWATVMAGSLSAAAGADERDVTAALTISWPEAAAEVFADYQREHRAWRSGAPELAPFVSESDQAGLQDAADHGLLMSLRDDHGFAGLAAATISPLFGRRAVCMLDVFLTERWRGKGLAPAIQSTFLAGQRSGADTVWGHIHAKNTPSLRTAQKMGRCPVQQEYFVSLPAF
ncbi:hypothetical protein NicSoilB4_17600 [Arthrobacter sp. NicSoilB4]|uniref:GNAT family N-acetyltransferase n=1 Tax=Arthrobacter sp. NicSoilB4 TaxID=2830997 RepID=UPI001CC64BA1|nr:GNAT family N-acetyltransferase [Arthrobacter sp. NicSoilB4]BCW66997.1 hypothetical protein NicSoilB4_17600 [Arthrobacter sp. NicSoilB4]